MIKILGLTLKNDQKIAPQLDLRNSILVDAFLFEHEVSILQVSCYRKLSEDLDDLLVCGSHNKTFFQFDAMYFSYLY